MRKAEGTLAVAGGTGFVGRRLVRALVEDGWHVRCLVRDRDRAAGLLGESVELVEVDLDRRDRLADALAGAHHAYFLVHMMGGGEDYAERERTAAAAFAAAASRAGVGRVSYLGGLGNASPHLSSRHRTAGELAAAGPPLTYFRAAMVVGPGSESYELLSAIVRRLPAAPAPSWLENRTQPIGVRDLVGYLRRSPLVTEAAGREVQIGGPEALSHRAVIECLAEQMAVDPPRWLSVGDRIANPDVIAAGAATLTPGDPGVAAQLALGLQEETVVTDPSGAEMFDLRPEPLRVVFQRCLAEQEAATVG